MTLPWRADWSLQDYVDRADFERERAGQKVSPRHRVVFVNRVRTFVSTRRLSPGDRVVIGDSYGLAEFEVTREEPCTTTSGSG